MPKLTQVLPKYRKHRASGQAVVTLSGRDYYLGPHNTKASRLEYDRLIAEWLANGRNPLGICPYEITIVELAARYWKFAKGYYRKRGKVTREAENIHIILRELTDLYGRQLAVEFGPTALKALRNGLVERDLSRRYVNHQIGRVKRMFKWAVSEELIPASAHEALATVTGLRRGRSAARETEPVEPVADEIVDQTLPLLSPVVADMVRFQRLAACRPGEVCALRPCDIDRTCDIWVYQFKEHKTEHHGRQRQIFIGPRAQQVLLRYLARDAKSHCFRPCDSEAKRLAARHANRETPLSCGNRPGTNRTDKPKRQPGERYDSSSYRRAVHYACDKAFPHPELSGIPKSQLTEEQAEELNRWRSAHRWSPNRLRHSAASEIRREFGLEAAQVVLGHAQANISEVYAERDTAKGLAVARQIG